MTIVVLRFGKVDGRPVPTLFDVIPETDDDAKLFSEWIEAKVEKMEARADSCLVRILSVAKLVRPGDRNDIGRAKQNQAKIAGVYKKRMELASSGWKGIWRPSTL